MISSRHLRRTAAVGAVVATALATVAITAPTALADDSSTLTVVGTSDVYDSNLIQSVIKPDFEARYPGVTLNYVSLGTGAAIAYAEQGSASALVVHAPSLENQFVAAGYSANDAPGNAFFWGDYVLLGPKSDPAGIAAHDPHNIAGAFERVAAAGKAGKVNYVSRGGTPGTTVQEHAIWALTNGVTTCDVSSTNGGGESPSTTTGACPTNISYPAWYHATGLTQGPNIENADSCNYSGGNCYVLTDRGTYQYLQSQNEISNLKIVTRDNNATARGGVALLVNTFHGYAVNPDKFSGSTAAGINETAAENFLAFVTSPAEQSKIGNYLNGSNDPPFIPSAAPVITASAPPDGTTGGRSITISGKVKNVVPGTPAIGNKPVFLEATDSGSPAVTTQVASTRTNGSGQYSFTVKATRSATYTVRTNQLTQVEYRTISPVFSDLLAPASKVAGSSQVTGAVTITKATAKAGVLTLTGTAYPKAVDGNATLTLYGSKDDAMTTKLGTKPLGQGKGAFTVSFRLAPGTYSYDLAYEDPNYVSLGYSDTRMTTVP